MITAKNYKTQVVAYLNDVINGKVEEFKNSDAETIELVKKLHQNLHKCNNFAIEDNGKILNAGWTQLDSNSKLPFPIISIEYYCSDKSRLNKHLTLAMQSQNELKIYSFFTLTDNSKWKMSPISSSIITKPSKDALYKYGDLIQNNAISWMVECFEPETIELLKALSTIDMSAVLELMEALSCRNVYFESLEPVSDKVNEKRIKAGKIPFYETKILVINPNGKAVDKTDKGGTHASPRQHLRRGHIRRYATYSIWINNTVVGKAENGRVDKSYNVKEKSN